MTHSQKVAGKVGVTQCVVPGETQCPGPRGGFAGDMRSGSLEPQPSGFSAEMTMHVQQLSLDALHLQQRGPEKPEVGHPAEPEGSGRFANCEVRGNVSKSMCHPSLLFPAVLEQVRGAQPLCELIPGVHGLPSPPSATCQSSWYAEAHTATSAMDRPGLEKTQMPLACWPGCLPGDVSWPGNEPAESMGEACGGGCGLK